MPRRCFFGCKPQHTITHKLPNPNRFPEQYKAWCTVITGNAESQLDHNMIVCDRHFTEKDHNRNHRLNANAVPSLFTDLLAQHTKIEQLTNCPPSSSQYLLMEEESLDLNTLTNDCVVIGSTNMHYIEDVSLNIIIPEVMSCKNPQIEEVQFLPSSSSDLLNREDISLNITSPIVMNSKDAQLEDVHSVSSVYPMATVNVVTSEHNYATQISCNKKRVHRALKKRSVPSLNAEEQRKIKNLRREVCRLRNRSQTFKTRLENAEGLLEKSVLQHIANKMSVPAKIFSSMQLKFANKKPKGRRFSIEEQILSLSLYKKSPKCYNFMAKMFVLPSTRTLKNLLCQVKLKTGINKVVFEKLKNTVKNFKLENRLCSLIFDEMSLNPQLHYDASQDEIKGLVSHGAKNIANHALVFMVKGLKKKYKQPVAYYFTNSLNKNNLKEIIKSILREIFSTGLIVLCTVCDQSTINVSVINDLIRDTRADCLRKGEEMRYDYFKCKSHKVIPLFDTPHLIKGLRNNLLTKDLKYVDYNDNKEKIIKWDYIQMLYTADKSSGELRCMPKLTEEHVFPEKIKKMRVETAAQIFSHSVAVGTLTLLRNGSLPQECQSLIPFISLIDNLFDSLNVSSLSKEDGKFYKWPIKKNSDHHELWQKSLKLLKSVKFITIKKINNKIRVSESVVPTITNFIRTIEGFQALWDVLSKKYGFDAMLTRHFNQDPVENFFGNIRSYGARNTAPNCVGFEGAYKSLLLNNYNSPQSLQANCEKDNNDCLNNLDFFLKDKTRNIVLDTPKENNIIFNNSMMFPEKIDGDQGQRNYVCGWVLRKCLQNICKSCKNCRTDLINIDNTEENSFISLKEYHKTKKWLCYTSSQLNRCFEEIQWICVSHLKENITTHGIKSTIICFTDIFVTFPFKCEIHKSSLKKYFVDKSIDILIYSWCRTINRILSGKVTYPLDGDDEFKIIAQKYYNKHSKHTTFK